MKEQESAWKAKFGVEQEVGASIVVHLLSAPIDHLCQPAAKPVTRLVLSRALCVCLCYAWCAMRDTRRAFKMLCVWLGSFGLVFHSFSDVGRISQFSAKKPRTYGKPYRIVGDTCLPHIAYCTSAKFYHHATTMFIVTAHVAPPANHT
jgi:hypothetical protein